MPSAPLMSPVDQFWLNVAARLHRSYRNAMDAEAARVFRNSNATPDEGDSMPNTPQTDPRIQAARDAIVSASFELLEPYRTYPLDDKKPPRRSFFNKGETIVSTAAYQALEDAWDRLVEITDDVQEEKDEAERIAKIARPIAREEAEQAAHTAVLNHRIDEANARLMSAASAGGPTPTATTRRRPARRRRA